MADDGDLAHRPLLHPRGHLRDRGFGGRGEGGAVDGEQHIGREVLIDLARLLVRRHPPFQVGHVADQRPGEAIVLALLKTNMGGEIANKFKEMIGNVLKGGTSAPAGG